MKCFMYVTNMASSTITQCPYMIFANLCLFINLINDSLEKVQSILLFTDIDRRIGPKPKYLPKSLRRVEL